MQKNILITGGAGFIGSHVVRLMVTKYPGYQIFNLDALTYAGNLENLKDIENAPNYHFVKADILDAAALKNIFEQHNITDVIHLAAESHVDRSIVSPLDFVYTNVIGTVNLLNTAKDFWKQDLSYENAHDGTWDSKRDHLFYHISTDEVYGSLGKEGLFTETTSYDPNSPYSASKAASDHFVRAYGETYHLPIVVSNCSNNYGPYQFPEKLIPHSILCLLQNKKIPIYGKGNQVRDWLFVEDHCDAIEQVLKKGATGETYLIGGNNEINNINLIKKIIKKFFEIKKNKKKISLYNFIKFVKDRPGHDIRYRVDTSLIFNSFKWRPATSLDKGINKTVKWYIENLEWIKNTLNKKNKIKVRP
jgi:dTDP-glucose 4,6-dehydratase